MDVFTVLFTALIPLYILIGLGWVAGRYFHVESQSLGSLAIYIIGPVVAFGFISDIDLQPVYAALPLVVFTLFSALTLLFYYLAKRVYADDRANLLALCAGTGNIGYFGFPLALMIFESQWVGVYMLALAGGLIYESTILYYLANRGVLDVRKSLKRLLKFPTIYAIIAGVFVNLTGIELPGLAHIYWEYFKGAYVIIGMMIIGASLSRVDKLLIAPRFLGLTFLGKFIAWPLITYSLIALDQHLTRFFSSEIHTILLIMAIVPPAANVTAFAASLNMRPDKAASTVLISTVFSLFYVPFVLWASGF